MKKLLVAVAAVLVSVSAFAQGTVTFNNRISGVVDAPVWRVDGSVGAGAGITAQLMLVGAGGSLTPLTPTSTFRVGANEQYLVAPSGAFEVPGAAAGTQVTLRLAAYETSAGSYQTALSSGALVGISNPVTVTLGGTPPGGGLPITTPGLAGLTGFTLVPEPSTIALGVLGAAALLLRRRK